MRKAGFMMPGKIVNLQKRSNEVRIKRITPTLAMFTLLLLSALPAFSQDAGAEWESLNHGAQALYLEGEDVQARLPERISNNAVALAVLDGEPVIYSFLGLGPGNTFRDTKLTAFEYRLVGKKGRVLPPVPGLHERHAPSVAVIRALELDNFLTIAA